MDATRLGQTPFSSRRSLIVACALLVVVPAIVDLLTSFINLPILYFIPLVLCARAGKRKALIWLTTLLVLLTYGLYFWEFRHSLFENPRRLLSYRFFNRTIVAVGLCITAAALSAWSRVHEQWLRRGAQVTDSEPDIAFDQAVRSLKRVIVILLCIALVLVIFMSDLLIPRQFNLPILYAVPLILTAWSDSRRALWALLPVVLICTWVGVYLGPKQNVPAEVAPRTSSR